MPQLPTPDAVSVHRTRPWSALSAQRGGFAMGVVVGVLVGLALALGVALWVTKVPVPFVNKVPQRTAEQDAAEAERNRSWDPNAPLATKSRAPVVSPAGSAPATAPAAAAAPATPVTPVAPAVVGGSARDPAAILAGKPTGGGANATPSAAAGTTTTTTSTTTTAPPPGTAASDGFAYFVQAGAYTRTEEAEQQRARLAIMGLDAKVTEREQSGRTMYRVRVGPYAQRDQAEAAKGTIDGAGIESVLVRVQRGN